MFLNNKIYDYSIPGNFKSRGKEREKEEKNLFRGRRLASPRRVDLHGKYSI